MSASMGYPRTSHAGFLSSPKEQKELTVAQSLTATAAPIPARCAECPGVAKLSSGAVIYPHRPDLASKPIWVCSSCGAYVGCHPNTKDPLGTCAGADLRKARSMLHKQMLDPLWINAPESESYKIDAPSDRLVIQRAARKRVYAFLADRLAISADDCHTGMFDLNTCRKAWRVLQGVSYREIRHWSKSLNASAGAEGEPKRRKSSRQRQKEEQSSRPDQERS